MERSNRHRNNTQPPNTNNKTNTPNNEHHRPIHHQRIKTKHNHHIRGDKMLTQKGESYLLNRLINNEANPITHITIGTGNTTPKKTDTELTNPVSTKRCLTKIDLRNKQLTLTATFTPTELQGVTEIGAIAEDTLITHDLITTTPSDLTSNINLKYVLKLENTSYKTNWQQYQDNIYYVYEPNTVTGVNETNTNTGYRKVQSTDDLVEASYYYDNTKELLYITTTDESNPNNKTIQITTQ